MLTVKFLFVVVVIVVLVVWCILFSDIQQLLNVGFAHDRSQESNNPHLEDSYILLLNVDMMDSQSSWTGKTIEITATAETIINLLELQASATLKIRMYQLRNRTDLYICICMCKCIPMT